jgi:hypothetical protein
MSQDRKGCLERNGIFLETANRTVHHKEMKGRHREKEGSIHGVNILNLMKDGREFKIITRRGINIGSLHQDTRKMMRVQVWATRQVTVFRLGHNAVGIVWKEDMIVKEVVAHVHIVGSSRQTDDGRGENVVLGTGSLKS